MGGIVIVDAGSPDQVGFDLPDVPLLVIDHHATNGWDLKEEDLMLAMGCASNNRNNYSISINTMHRIASQRMSEKCLLAGLITDTGRFKHADQSSFKTASASA